MLVAESSAEALDGKKVIVELDGELRLMALSRRDGRAWLAADGREMEITGLEHVYIRGVLMWVLREMQAPDSQGQSNAYSQSSDPNGAGSLSSTPFRMPARKTEYSSPSAVRSEAARCKVGMQRTWGACSFAASFAGAR